MQHTTNYNLNQWEDADRVTRADVNADNTKLDAALTGLDSAIAGIEPSPLVKVWGTTLTEETTQIDLDVAQLGLADYVLLILAANLPAIETPLTVRVLVDNIEQGYSWESSPGSITNNASGFFPFNREAFLVLRSSVPFGRTHCIAHSTPSAGTYEVENFFYPRLLSEITTLNIRATVSGSVLPIGSRFSLYGLKW